MRKRILLVEDDRLLGQGLKFDLMAEGYQVDLAESVRQGLALGAAGGYDLAVLDINLPDGDGFSLCRELKARGELPVIFLTANDLEENQLQGFDLGAEDYVTKPFSMPVFRRRVAAVLARTARTESRVYSDGFLTIRFAEMALEREGEAVPLTPTEFKLLTLFVENAGAVLSREVLLDRLWDQEGNFVDAHALTVNIGRLRGKLEDEDHKYIKTVYGVGYQWIGGK